MNATTFLGGARVDLAKAAKRGKVKSVDWALNRQIARGLDRRLMQLFSEWRKRAVSRLRGAYAEHVQKANDELIDRIMRALDLESFSVDVVEEMTPALRRTFREAGISALEEIKFATGREIVEHVDERAVAYASQHGADLVTRIKSATRDDLREQVSNAVQEGLSAQAFADQIEQSFGFSEARSIMIARTELAFAHVQGNVAGWRESGVVEGKKWLVAQDNVCPGCEALDGQVAELDGEFKSDEYGEISGPPAHPNCRCDVVAVLAPKGEDED